jgi:hypothetical protein
MKKMGIDPKQLTGQLKYTLENGALSYAKLDDPTAGFGKLPKTRTRRQSRTR